ncbi:hypothetical protein GO986_14625 [Deinococcus sp. HMF7620]|uniref:Uncharacterized protein n=1 Tax=Deinococcus arboris TaxID=2682977 RepID=A0A7C9HSP6_9DEIO|nr:hypothetical protein [Deinococcus arboris]MVN87989.1 hypothetical protein [Deinococcus arboris]
MRRLLLLSAALLSAPPAAAQGAAVSTGPTCTALWDGLDPATLRPARVTARRPLLTLASGELHPTGVMTGDLVLQAASVGGRRCTYVPGDASRTGLLRDQETQPLTVSTLTPGTWERDANAGLTLTRQANQLRLTGMALFPTAGGSVNAGHLNGPLRRAGTAAPWLYADGDCTAALWPVGTWLLVLDSGTCGGLNVSFSGLYRRVR